MSALKRPPNRRSVEKNVRVRHSHGPDELTCSYTSDNKKNTGGVFRVLDQTRLIAFVPRPAMPGRLKIPSWTDSSAAKHSALGELVRLLRVLPSGCSTCTGNSMLDCCFPTNRGLTFFCCMPYGTTTYAIILTRQRVRFRCLRAPPGTCIAAGEPCRR